MLSSKDNNGTVYSFRDNSPILKNNLFDALFAKVKFAKIFIWSSEGLVQKELTPDTSNVTVFVKDTAIVLFRKLGSQWFTGNYVGVLSLGNDSNIEIFSRFENDKHKFAFINHMLNKIYNLDDWLLTQGGNNKIELNFECLLKQSFLSKLKKAYCEGEYNPMKKLIRMIPLLEALSI